jgi:hypothetical protein
MDKYIKKSKSSKPVMNKKLLVITKFWNSSFIIFLKSDSPKVISNNCTNFYLNTAAYRIVGFYIRIFEYSPFPRRKRQVKAVI